MLDVRVLRTLAVKTESGQGHLSAASGLVQLGNRLYAVADDDNSLGVFSLAGNQAGTLLRLFDGELPSDPKARKAAKADLEALALLPAFPGHPYGALLALGSGSRAQRHRAALLVLNDAGDVDGAVRELDLAPLYASVHARHELLNIEGAFVGDGMFYLLQRGNEAAPSNVLIGFDWTATERWLCRSGPAPKLVSMTEYKLGDIDGVPLTFTDGTALPNGGWVFCAAAEATADNYADGPCRGSAVGVVAADGQLRVVLPLSLKCKAEGIAATVEDGLLHLLMVTDADDPDMPALLLAATLKLPVQSDVQEQVLALPG